MSIVGRGFALGNNPGAVTARGLGGLDLGIVTVIRAAKEADLTVAPFDNVISIAARLPAFNVKPETRIVSAKQTEIVIPVANRKRTIVVPPDQTLNDV